MVSWGVVEGTNIGYIYALDWFGNPPGQSGTLFGQAVDELLHKDRVRGLILDFRTNTGGYAAHLNDGFTQLFNIDPTPNFSQALRVRGTDHFNFTLSPPDSVEDYWPDLYFTPTTYPFDHPIAVLTGPACGSMGDYNAFRMRFHPMARFFGMPTSGAYTAVSNQWWAQYPFGTLAGPYFCRVDDGSVYSNYNSEGYMIHKPFPVDDHVWLTRDGVAKGQDDVLNHALAWITSLT